MSQTTTGKHNACVCPENQWAADPFKLFLDMRVEQSATDRMQVNQLGGVRFSMRPEAIRRDLSMQFLAAVVPAGVA